VAGAIAAQPFVYRKEHAEQQPCAEGETRDRLKHRLDPVSIGAIKRLPPPLRHAPHKKRREG